MDSVRHADSTALYAMLKNIAMFCFVLFQKKILKQCNDFSLVKKKKKAKT